MRRFLLSGIVAGLALAGCASEAPAPAAGEEAPASHSLVLGGGGLAAGDKTIAFSQERAEAEAALAGGGRLVLRPSGTEPVVRVTVEADDDALMRQVLERLAGAVRAAA